MLNHFRTAALCCIALVSSVLQGAPPDGNAPVMVFAQQALTISNVTPGGRVVLFVVVREPLRYASRTATVSTSADELRGGVR